MGDMVKVLHADRKVSFGNRHSKTSTPKGFEKIIAPYRAGLFFGRPVSTDVPDVVRLTTGATRWLEAGTIVHPGGFLTC